MLRAVLLTGACLVYSVAQADPAPTQLDSNGKPVWAAGAIAAAKRAANNHASINLESALPPGSASRPGDALPQPSTFRDASGVSSTFISSGGVRNKTTEPFFQSLGTNGRTCETCHQADAGHSITPVKIKSQFNQDSGSPLFRLVDGAVCPSADVSTAASKRDAYKLLIGQGLIRVFIPLPSDDTLEFKVTVERDPYGCNSNPSTGLSSPTTGLISQYRRPLPSTNLRFLTTIMWDGREPSLESQAADATQVHAQGALPAASVSQQIVALESELFSAQSWDKAAGDLTDGVQGGPKYLSTVPFQLGINNNGAGFNPAAMTVYLNWAGESDSAKASIARGQTIFNERSFDISGVAGLNDIPGSEHITGTCTTCHNTPQVGDHSVPLPLDLGLANAPGQIPGGAAMDNGGLPVFAVECTRGPSAGTKREVTDLGRGLITGKCADIGKFKGPILRNLAARPPYFHNGSAPNLDAVVAFYDERFNIGLSDQDIADLIAFLKAL